MSIAFEKSETHRNLLRAFAGESQARNRYTFAAGLAKKQNLQVIEQVFLFTADQERAHAKVFYNYLQSLSGQNITIDGAYPIDLYPTTLEHLRAAQRAVIGALTAALGVKGGAVQRHMPCLALWDTAQHRGVKAAQIRIVFV